MEEQEVKITYTVVNHTARQKLGLSVEEYCVIDLIYHIITDISKQEWCYFSKDWIGEQLGVTKQWVNKIIKKLIEKGYLESRDGKVNKSKGKHLRITIGWYELVYMNKKKLSKGGNSSFHEGGNENAKGGNENAKGGNEVPKTPGYTMNTMNTMISSSTKEEENAPTVKEVVDSVPAKFKNTIGYMRAVPEEDILHWIEKFPIFTRDNVIREIGKAKGWLEANGKTKKDYQAFTRNWLDNAAERLEKQKGGGYGPRVSVQE